MEEEKMPLGEDKQIFYNFVIPISAFVIFAFILCWILIKVNGALPTTISFSGASLVALASFRMIRGISYDKLFRWLRELFKYNKTTVEGIEGSEKIVVRSKVSLGFRRVIDETLGCPWCTGFWSTAIALFLYYLSPVTYILLLLLALSAVASFIQLSANVVGNKYEILEKENDRMGE